MCINSVGLAPNQIRPQTTGHAAEQLPQPLWHGLHHQVPPLARPDQRCRQPSRAQPLRARLPQTHSPTRPGVLAKRPRTFPQNGRRWPRRAGRKQGPATGNLVICKLTLIRRRSEK